MRNAVIATIAGIIITIVILVCLGRCVSKPALINLPDQSLVNPADNGGTLGNAKPDAMIDQLLKMFWFMVILSILLTWIGVLWLKRIVSIKAYWLSIIVNILILGLWELFVWLGWSHNHWKDVFVVGLCSWYAQAVLYDKLNLKRRLSGKKKR